MSVKCKKPLLLQVEAANESAHIPAQGKSVKRGKFCHPERAEGHVIC